MLRFLALLAFVAGSAGAVHGTRAIHVVGQKDKHFSRDTLRVRPGDVVTFENNDEVTHNVFSKSAGLSFNLLRQAPGAAASVPIASTGVAQVRCAFHPTMKLTIISE